MIFLNLYSKGNDSKNTETLWTCTIKKKKTQTTSIKINKTYKIKAWTV